MVKKRPRPRDTSLRALDIVRQATEEAPEPVADDPVDDKPEKNAAAVELGRRGGLVGGKARAAKLSPERRREIAKKAAAARWADR